MTDEMSTVILFHLGNEGSDYEVHMEQSVYLKEYIYGMDLNDIEMF